MDEENKVAETEATKSTPEKAKKSGGAGKKAIIAGCVLIACCVITLVAAGVIYAFTSNKDIPVISDIVEKTENIAVSEDKQKEMVQEDMVNTVFSTLIPLTEDKDGKSMIKADFTKEDLESMITEKKDVKSVRYDVTLNTTTEKAGSLKISIKGFQKQADDMSYDGDANFDGTFSMSGIQMSAKGEVRYMGDSVYVKITELPAMAEMYSDLKDQWIKADMTDMDSMVAGDMETSDEPEITKEDLQNIKTFLMSEEVKETITRLDDEVINGVRTNCFQIDLNSDNLTAIIQKAEDVFDVSDEDKMSESDLEDLKNLDYLKIVLCSGRKDKMLYKASLDMKMTYEDDGPVTVSLDMNLWDYNKVNDNVEEPKDAKTLDEIMQGLYGGYMPDDSFDQGTDDFDDYNWDYNYDFNDPGMDY